MVTCRLITISQAPPNRKSGWVVKVRDQGEYKDLPPLEPPNGLGFYYFRSDTKTDADAFQELRDAMVRRHQVEIERLQKSMDLLKQLKLE